MGSAAEPEVRSTERAATPSGEMRTLWPIDGGRAATPAPDRQALVASLRGVLERWRAAERQVAELAAASSLLDTIATYRLEHRRIFEEIQRLTNADEVDR